MWQLPWWRTACCPDNVGFRCGRPALELVCCGWAGLSLVTRLLPGPGRLFLVVVALRTRFLGEFAVRGVASASVEVAWVGVAAGLGSADGFGGGFGVSFVFVVRDVGDGPRCSWGSGK